MPRTLTEEERQRIYNLGRASIPCTNGWLPIETAPKDGTEVLVFYTLDDGVPDIAIAWFSNSKWYNCYNMNPTHWQPLPKPPPESL